MLQIKKLIETFIKKQETINLVVVPANVDIATTEALKMAKTVDPNGQRTLGNVVLRVFHLYREKGGVDFVICCLACLCRTFLYIL